MIEKGQAFKTKIILFVLITIANVLLARYAALSISNVPGIPTFYFAVAFMIPFTLWFGAWGAASAYIGCLIGSGIPAGLPWSTNLFWSLADLWQVLIPLLAFRMLRADLVLKAKKDWIVFLAFGWILNNLAGAVWGSTVFVASGQVSGEFGSLFANWFLGNLAVTITLTPWLLRYGTPLIRKRGMLVKSY